MKFSYIFVWEIALTILNKVFEFSVSLTQIQKFLQKLFTIPVDPSHGEIPHTLVNHNKYMVTEKIAYFGEFLDLNCI